MSRLPQEAVLEYQTIFLQLYGKQISYQEAEKQATELISIFRAVYRPIKKNWLSMKGGKCDG